MPEFEMNAITKPINMISGTVTNAQRTNDICNWDFDANSLTARLPIVLARL